MTTPIRGALVPGSSLGPRVKDGLRALKREHAAFVDERLRSSFSDSLDLDESVRAGHERENRWDYLIGHEETSRIFGLEPHTANNHEVATVIKKRAMALEQLRGHLKQGHRVADWFWVASGKVDFLPIEKAHARLATNGIQFVGKALLGKHLGAGAPETRSRSEVETEPAKKPRRR